jgi:hypothetical protein
MPPDSPGRKAFQAVGLALADELDAQGVEVNDYEFLALLIDRLTEHGLLKSKVINGERRYWLADLHKEA